MPRTLTLFLLCVFLVLGQGVAQAQNYGVSSHGNRANLPLGCATCHEGHGIAGTAMLKSEEEEGCLTCHGDISSRNINIQKGELSGLFSEMENIGILMRKRFTHFGSTLSTTRKRLHLEKRSGSDKRCSACHNPHYSGSPNPFQGLPGITLQGIFVPQAQHEYEVCFRCHSEPPGSPPSNFRDIRLEFQRTTAVSSHPIGLPVKAEQSFSISLIDQKTEYVLTCYTCHGDSKRQGSNGMHGSDYPYLLKKNLEIVDYIPESASGSSLCYSCHERESIMGNESFVYHAEHLNGVFTATPCITCHSGHGSRTSYSLISFDPAIVVPSQTGLLSFDATGTHSGVCYLKCHNAEHSGSFYRNEEITVAGEHPFSEQIKVLTLPPGKSKSPGKRKKPKRAPQPRPDRESHEIQE